MQNQVRVNWALKTKFLVTIVALVSITTLTTILVLYTQLSSLLVNEKYSQLDQSLSFINAQIQQEIEQLRTDAKNLANSRLIQGILESTQEGNNLLSLIKQEEWNESLQVLFYQTLASNSNYFKVRYIEYEVYANQASAMEQVLALRQGDQIQLLAPYEMQDKIHRDYIQQSLRLSANEVYLSELSLNREYNQISPGRIATLRAVAPIFLREHLRGFVVVSLDVSRLFRQIKETMGTGAELYVYRDDGQYYFHPDQLKAFSFEFPEEFQYTIQQEFLGSDTLLEQEEPAQGQVYGKSLLPYAMVQQSLFFDPMEPERALKLALVQTYDTINEITSKLNRSLLATGLIIGVIALGVALLLFRNLSQPIQQLLESIEQFGESQEVIDLPVERTDEIGTLAKRFQRMSEQVKQQTNQLNQENLVRRFTEKRLRYEEKELKRSNSELEKFAYVASHDLQEPLRKVQAFGDSLRERAADQLDDKSKDYLERMQQAARRMSTLINDLLSFSRIATRGRPFKRCDLNEILSGVLADLEVAIEQSKTHLEISPLPELEVDEPQVRQLFQNLVGNAIKFRKPEGEHKLTIWSRVKEGGNEVTIHFKDNGIGLEQQYADRIFEVFQRLHARNEYEGTGIGLAICRKIVERHGGTIEVVGAVNKGAEFIVTLPIERG